MRAVIDTNILVSALITTAGNPAAIVDAWLDGKFTLLICEELMDEVRATLNKPKIAARIKPHNTGRFINQIRELAEDVGALPSVRRSSDPADDFLLAMSEAGEAHYLVTGDKSGLLALDRHKATRIVSARSFAALFASPKS